MRGFGEISKGGGDASVLKIGEKVRIRLLALDGNPVAAWDQHAIEDPKDKDQAQFVVCPGSGCPLCRKPTSPEKDKDGRNKQYFPRSARYAINVWSYEHNAVKTLIAGPQIFKEFENATKAGIDVTTRDWIITREGKGRSTKYITNYLDPSDFGQQTGPEDLQDLSKYEKSDTIDAIFKKLEDMGIDYDALPIPEFTLQEAEEFVMPYGKHRGETMEQIASNDLSYLQFMHGRQLEQGRYGDPVFIAMQTVLEDRGEVEPLGEVGFTPPPTPQAEPTPEPAAQTAPTPSEPEASDLVEMIGPDGKTNMVPESTVEALLAAGYTRPEPEPEPEPEEPAMVVLIAPDKTETPFPAEVVDAMLAAGYTRKDAEPETVKPSEAREVPGDEYVKVRMGGGPEMSVKFEDCMRVLNQGGIEVIFTDPEVNAYANTQLEFNQRQGPDPEPSAVGEAMSKLHDDAHAEADGGKPMADGGSPGQSSLDGEPTKGEDDQWTHPALEKPYKTKGSATQALNRLRKKQEDAAPAEPAPAAPPAAPAADGEDTQEAALERVKDLLANGASSDYGELLKMFDEIAGKRTLTEFNLSELQQLESRLQTKAAA